jgi:hypothetical protein
MVYERPLLGGIDSVIEVRALPQTIMGYVFRYSGKHQFGLAVLSIAVFTLSMVPLELQRRIINDAIKGGTTPTILWFAAVYAGVALAEQGLKLILNIYPLFCGRSRAGSGRLVSGGGSRRSRHSCGHRGGTRKVKRSVG